MALTRTQIKTLVQSYTGKLNKATLIETLCDLALNEAVRKYPFDSSRLSSPISSAEATETHRSMIQTVADEVEITLPATVVNLISVELLDTSTDVSYSVALKPDWWFAKLAGSNQYETQGIPEYACRQGGVLKFNRPFDAVYTVRIRYSWYPVFEEDDDENPIAVLDTFLVDYVTAHVFLSIEDKDNFAVWMVKAVGSDFNDWQGGAFADAVKADKDEYAKETTLMDITVQGKARPVFMTDEYDTDTGEHVAYHPWY